MKQKGTLKKSARAAPMLYLLQDIQLTQKVKLFQIIHSLALLPIVCLLLMGFIAFLWDITAQLKKAGGTVFLITSLSTSQVSSAVPWSTCLNYKNPFSPSKCSRTPSSLHNHHQFRSPLASPLKDTKEFKSFLQPFSGLPVHFGRF